MSRAIISESQKIIRESQTVSMVVLGYDWFINGPNPVKINDVWYDSGASRAVNVTDCNLYVQVNLNIVFEEPSSVVFSYFTENAKSHNPK